MHYIRSFQKGSQTCQIHKIGSTSQRCIETVTLNTCIEQVQVMNYVLPIPSYRGITHENSDTLINYVFCKHGSQNCLFFEADQAVLSSIMHCIYKRLVSKLRP